MAINHKHFPENSPDIIGDLLLSMVTLSYSIEEWFLSNHLHQTKLLLPETVKELAKWEKELENVCKDYHDDLDSSLSVQIEDALESHINILEGIVNKNLDKIKQLSISSQEKENFYRLLGSYYGLSHSLISYAAAAEQINWKHWEEEFFA